MSNIDKRALRHSAESIISILENIAGFEPSDIDGDSVELRFETEDGFDTGCDVSIVDQCQKTADVVRALLDELERNQQYIKRRDQENEDIALTVGKLRVELEASEKRIAELRDWNAGLAQESLTYQQRVAELEVIKSAAEKLVRCKGRYHSEQNYRALAALFGVTVPDLPPLEAESVSQTYKLNELSGNSPVTPDGWISCSERMPVIGELNWRTSFPLLITCEIGVIPAYYGFVSVNGDRHYGFMESLKYGDYSGNHPQTNEYGLISNVTHWMPLPEPPL
ncbi:TPA: ead/Ea22-like family protein [Escherichia coli]